jgi:hypothetical protein
MRVDDADFLTVTPMFRMAPHFGAWAGPRPERGVVPVGTSVTAHQAQFMPGGEGGARTSGLTAGQAAGGF